MPKSRAPRKKHKPSSFKSVPRWVQSDQPSYAKNIAATEVIRSARNELDEIRRTHQISLVNGRRIQRLFHAVTLLSDRGNFDFTLDYVAESVLILSDQYKRALAGDLTLSDDEIDKLEMGVDSVEVVLDYFSPNQIREAMVETVNDSISTIDREIERRKARESRP